MSSSTKTPNYNLSQFADADKPTWRGDYTGDMAKIDRGMQCNANAAADAHTAATNAQQTANTAVSKADANTTAIAQVKTTADNALSLAHTNETDIATNDGEFQSYKNSTNSQLATIIQRLNSLDAIVATKKTTPPEGYQVGAHVKCSHTGESSATTFRPAEGHGIPYSEMGGNGSQKWASLASGNILLQPGTYMFNVHARIVSPNHNDRTFRLYFAVKPQVSSSWDYPGDIYADCYPADLGAANPSQDGQMTFVFEIDEPSHVGMRIQILGTGEDVSAKIGPSVMYITRQNDGSGATRSA